MKLQFLNYNYDSKQEEIIALKANRKRIMKFIITQFPGNKFD